MARVTVAQPNRIEYDFDDVSGPASAGEVSYTERATMLRCGDITMEVGAKFVEVRDGDEIICFKRFR